jgi:hypothetical protein
MVKVAQNVIVGAAGLFIPDLWFGMDFQGAASTDAAALQSRQQYLGILAAQRCAPRAAIAQTPQMAPKGALGPPASTPAYPVQQPLPVR